jgi:hypothetical protein
MRFSGKEIKYLKMNRLNIMRSNALSRLLSKLYFDQKKNDKHLKGKSTYYFSRRKEMVNLNNKVNEIIIKLLNL